MEDHPLSGVLKSRTVSGILQNKRLVLGGKIAAGVSLAWLIPTVWYEAPNRQNPALTPELQAIDQSLKEARSKADPFVRERFVQTEAKRLGLSRDDYKQLYAIRKPDSEVLPDVPPGPPLLRRITWFYQDLSRTQRLKLVWGWGVEAIKAASGLAFLVVGGRFLLEIPQRERQAKYQAWQVVHAAHGQKVSGARIAALEDLLAQRESFAGLQLEGTDLTKINLARANLQDANLRDANLQGANLQGANLRGANLQGVNLEGAELQGSQLHGANFQEANLCEAKLQKAVGWGTNFQNAIFLGGELQQADLWGAKLQKARFLGTNLQNTNFLGAEVEGCAFFSHSGMTAEMKDDLNSNGAIFFDKYPPEPKPPKNPTCESRARIFTFRDIYRVGR